MEDANEIYVRPSYTYKILTEIYYIIFFSFMYDIQSTPNYELTYLWFAHGTYACVVGSTGIDTLFYASAFNLCGHFRIIQSRAKRIIFERTCPDSKRVLLSEELRDLIKYHKTVMDLCNQLLTNFRPIIFTQIFFSSLNICVIAYQLTLVMNVNEN